MVDDSFDEPETFRRDLLATLATVGIGGVSGCSSLLDSSIVDEGFETDEYRESLVDDSQLSVSPSITDEYAASGSQSLLLASSPGTESRNGIASPETTLPLSTSVSLRTISDAGSENDFSIVLMDTASEAKLRLLYSDYYTPALQFRESHSEDLNKYVQEVDVAPSFETNAWFDVSLEADAEEIRITIPDKDVSERIELMLDWDSRNVRVSVRANAWGMGHALSLAMDEFQVESL